MITWSSREFDRSDFQVRFNKLNFDKILFSRLRVLKEDVDAFDENRPKSS